MIRLFWGVVLMLHPFILKISTISAIREGKDHFLLMAVALSLTLFAGKQTLPKFEKYVFALLIGISVLNCTNFYSSGTLYQSIYFFSGVLLISHFYRVFQEDDFDYLMNFLAITATISVVFATFSYFGEQPYFYYFDYFFEKGVKAVRRGQDYITGPLANGNLDGAYLAFALPSIFRKKWCYLAPVFIFGLYMHSSVASWVSSAGVCLYYIWLKFSPTKKATPFIIVACGMMLLFASSYFIDWDFDSGRFWTWDKALRLSSIKTVLIGNGLGWFYDNFSRHYIVNNGRFRHPHNEFLAMYFSFGTLGVVLLYNLIKRAVRSNSPQALMGLFAVFIDSFANFNFHISPLALIGIFYYTYCLKTVEVTYD